MVQQISVTKISDANERVKPHHFLIRFNTKHGDTNLFWRVFDNGVEKLVTAFYARVPIYSEICMEDGVRKFNVACDGFLRIEDDIAHISQIPT